MKKSTKSENPSASQSKPAAKKTVERKPAKKDVAPRKVPTPKKTTAAPASGASAAPAGRETIPPPALAPVVTTLVARIDVGFGNQLFVRGEGPGLSWDDGVPMVCMDDDHWTVALEGATKPVVFKFLINDRNWSIGADYRVAPGATAVLTPSFE